MGMLKASGFALSLVVLLFGAEWRPAGTQGPATLLISIDGGYAYGIDSTARSVTIGTIAPPSDATEHFREHRLRLELKEGDFVVQSSDMPPVPISEGAKTLGWDLTGYHVEIESGSATPQGVKLPPTDEAAARASCNGPAPKTNNLAFIPEVAGLAAGGKVTPASWVDAVQGDLKLTSGELAITSLAGGCMVFKDAAGTEKRRQRIANGMHGVGYSRDLTQDTIKLVFRGCCSQPVGTAVFRAVNGKLSFDLGSHMRDTGEDINTPQTHFEMFYRVLTPRPEKGQRLIPTWMIDSALKKSPGEGCPSGRYLY
jgi:hypothetical protein